MNWKIYKKRRLGRELSSLTNEEQDFLFSVIEEDEELVLEELLKCNVNLIHKLCHKHSNRGVEYSDLFSSGMIGLVIAARKFEVDKGIKFTTYAYYWINQKIVRCIEQAGEIIRLPAHIIGSIRQLENNIEGLSLLELANITGKSLCNLVSAEMAKEIDVVSMTGENSILEISSGEDIEENYILSERDKLLWMAVSELDYSERTLIWGFFKEERGVEELCKSLLIDKKEFDKILKRALFKLKRNPLLMEVISGKK